MSIRMALLLAVIWCVSIPAFAQDDAGVEPDSGSADAGSPPMTEDNSATAQVGTCTTACLQRVMSGDIRLDQCVSQIPECAGLEALTGSIRAGICEQARDVVSQCSPAESDPPSATAAAATGPTPRQRPRRLELICEEGRVEGSGWRAHCECGDGRVPVSESRYGIPFRERRLRYSASSPIVVRVVYCVPGNPTAVAAAREAVSSDLDARVSALESSVQALDQRVTALEARPAASADGTGLSEDRVREIVREVTGDFVTSSQLHEIVEGLTDIDESLGRRIETNFGRIRCLEGDTGWQTYRLADGSTQRYRCRERPTGASSSGTQGSFGFRLSGLLSVGFQPISLRNQDSIVPIYLAGELGVTVSFADRWYLEGAVGFGYAFEDAEVGDGFQGQYRIGMMHLFNVETLPMGLAFGGIVTERYDGGFNSGTFTSDHTLAGGYLDLLFNAPTRGAAFYAFVRLMGGAGLRFSHPDDHLNFDGGIQFGIGLARFGDD